ncbi:oxidoreductase [Streptomyces sp. NBRC 110611]|nr:oxidoreductase [Streptomyces sp. NBRC 110611]
MEEYGTNQAPGDWCDEWNHHTNDGGFVASPRTPLDQGLHPLRGRMKEVQCTTEYEVMGSVADLVT